jgi:uncharacterized UBP type Zn finger protein
MIFINIKNSSYEAISDLFCKKDDKKKASLVDVQSRLAKTAHRFYIGQQEDAHEFLLATLDQLALSGLKDENVGIRKGDLEKHDPVLQKVQFNVQHTLKCTSPICREESKTTELFRDFSLFFHQSGSSYSLNSLLDSFFKSELVEYICGKCKHPEAQFHHVISSPPKTLFLHLKRFEMYNSVSKNCSAVEIPLTLSLNRFALDPNDGSYILTGIVSHLGTSLHKGHYVFSKRDPSNNLWTQYNDAVVTKNLMDQNELRKKDAYILLYELALLD